MFPLYFNVPMEDGNNNHSMAKIYKIKLPSNEELSLIKNFGKNLSKEKIRENEDNPIVIINPLFSHDKSYYLFILGELLKINVLDRISIGYKNEII